MTGQDQSAIPGGVTPAERRHFEIEQRGAVVRLVFDNPERRNPLGSATVVELTAALRAADANPEVGAIVLTGRGETFSAGADLKEFRGSLEESARVHWETGDVWSDLFSLVPAMAKPLVAAVNGPAMAGGCGLVALCDLAIASDRAKFGTPEVNIGLAPLFILPALVRAVGRRQALALTLSGRTIDAREAARIGLVHEVVPHDELDRASMALAEDLARKGRFTLRLGKHAFYQIAELDYESGLAFARAIRGTFLQSDELRDGISKFFARQSR